MLLRLDVFDRQASVTYRENGSSRR